MSRSSPNTSKRESPVSLSRAITRASGAAVLVGVVAASLGPRVFAPHDRGAGAPFTYAPPPGFVPAEPATQKILEGSVRGAETAWVRPSVGMAPGYVPNVSIVRTAKRPPVENDELAALAQSMPKLYGANDGTWKEIHHATHVRPDGARVGVIEAEIAKDGTAHRSLQIAFPTDDGAAIVTASYPTEEEATYRPLFEKTIEASSGVRYLAPPPPPWAYAAWGGFGALATIALGVVAARANRSRPAAALT